MKHLVITLSLLLPVSVLAQNALAMGGSGMGGNMSQKDMYNMMMNARKMRACMQTVDQSRMPALEQQGRRAEAEVKSLCSTGKRDQAQQQAVQVANELMHDPDIRKMMECSKIMGNMTPQMQFMVQAGGSGDSVQHVCDMTM